MAQLIKKIDLYVRPKKIMIMIPEREMPSLVHTYKYQFPPERRKSTTKHLSEVEKTTIKLLKEFSEEKGIILSIHTINTRRDIFRAGLKGINDTPATVVGNQVIIGIPKLDEIKKTLAK